MWQFQVCHLDMSTPQKLVLQKKVEFSSLNPLLDPFHYPFNPSKGTLAPYFSIYKYNQHPI